MKKIKKIRLYHICNKIFLHTNYSRHQPLATNQTFNFQVLYMKRLVKIFVKPFVEMVGDQVHYLVDEAS